MGRLYFNEFQNVAITAVQDLFEFLPGAAMAIKLHSFGLGQITQTSVELLQISVRHMTSTVTSGSGGSAATEVRAIPGDAANTYTCEVNNTTVATTSGTSSVLLADTWNLLNGYFLQFEPDAMPVATISQGLFIRLDSAPAASRTCSGWAIIEELL